MPKKKGTVKKKRGKSQLTKKTKRSVVKKKNPKKSVARKKKGKRSVSRKPKKSRIDMWNEWGVRAWERMEWGN